MRFIVYVESRIQWTTGSMAKTDVTDEMPSLKPALSLSGFRKFQFCKQFRYRGMWWRRQISARDCHRSMLRRFLGGHSEVRWVSKEKGARRSMPEPWHVGSR